MEPELDKASESCSYIRVCHFKPTWNLRHRLSIDDTANNVGEGWIESAQVAGVGYLYDTRASRESAAKCLVQLPEDFLGALLTLIYL